MNFFDVITTLRQKCIDYSSSSVICSLNRILYIELSNNNIYSLNYTLIFVVKEAMLEILINK